MAPTILLLAWRLLCASEIQMNLKVNNPYLICESGDLDRYMIVWKVGWVLMCRVASPLTMYYNRTLDMYFKYGCEYKILCLIYCLI